VHLHLPHPHLPHSHRLQAHLPHVRLPQLPLPAVLLSLVYATAIAVALGDPGRHTLAGLVVLAGLTARWALRHRLRAIARVPVGAEPAVAPAPASAAA
jgi:hypothetical protein